MADAGAFRATCVGGPTVLLEMGKLRLLTDPTFDPAGTVYADGPVSLRKLAGSATPAEKMGPVDALLLSHDQHKDSLDRAGRAYPRAMG
jgi:L-ascorbate metabolism protein UlaG (beta-lactamase superfamily)